MIKSLLEPDEPESKEKTENVKNEPESDALRLPFQNALKKSGQIPIVEALPEKNVYTPENVDVFEQNETHQPNEFESRLAEIESMSESEIEKLFSDENLLNPDEPYLYSESKMPTETPYADVQPAMAKSVYDEVIPIDNANISQNREINPPEVKAKDYTPETQAESIRQSGMAWSAAIALFGSVVFFMVIGWFADLLLGTAPWSLVGGIVIGGIMGFVQFFRISSQIFKPQKSEFERTSFRGNENAEVVEVIETVKTAPTEVEK